MPEERMTPHILSVSYDEALLRTREMHLRREGYVVTSALGFTEGIEECKKRDFDLFVLGHSIPDKDKRELIHVFRTDCDAPVLALHRHGENTPEEADADAYPDDIEGFLNAVKKLLTRKTALHSGDGRYSSMT
jgi:DNA-binding response OmpR family regulator